MSENKKDKNLSEKDVEKVSGGMPVQKIIGRDKLTPAEIRLISQPMAYAAPGMFPKPGKIVSLKEIQQKKKTSSPNEVKNLQPFPDEDKDKN